MLNPDEILVGGDLEIDSLSYSDSKIDSVFDPEEILQGKDLEVDSLCYLDSEIDSEFGGDPPKRRHRGRLVMLFRFGDRLRFDTDEILQGEDLEIDFGVLLGLGDRLKVRPRHGRLRGDSTLLFAVNDDRGTSRSRRACCLLGVDFVGVEL